MAFPPYFASELRIRGSRRAVRQLWRDDCCASDDVCVACAKTDGA
jgi:hypothetical protein